MPKGAKPVPRAAWNFESGVGWGCFWEKGNTFGGSAGAARLAPGEVFSTDMCSSHGYGEDDNANVLTADTWFTLACHAENLKAVRVQFFFPAQQRLMEARIGPLEQKTWQQVRFNLLETLVGPDVSGFPGRPRVGDRITKVIVRAVPAAKGKPVLILDEMSLFYWPAKPGVRPDDVLPAQSANRVKIRLVLKEVASVSPSQIDLPRIPGGKRIAATFVFDHPTGPGADLFEARVLAKHGWKGTYLLRGLNPRAIKFIPELEKLGMEIGSLPKRTADMNGLSYSRNLDEAVTNRLALERVVKNRPILSFENPDNTHRGGYGPFWVGTYCMRAVRDAGFLIQNGWGKYCYLGYIPKPRWGRDVSTAMIQLYCRRPGASEPVHLLPGMPPHECLGFEENFSMPLTGAREIYGRINEFAWDKQVIVQKYDQMVRYTKRFDLGKVIVMKTLGVSRNARKNVEKILKQFGGREDFWYATLGEIGTYEYLRAHSRVVPVEPENKAKEIDLAVEMADVNPAFVRQALTVRLDKALAGKVRKVLVEGKSVKVTTTDAGVFFDVPLKALLRKPLKAQVEVAKKTWTIPGRGGIALTVKNPGLSGKTVEQVKWLVPDSWGWKITPAQEQGNFRLGWGNKRVLRYRVETTTAAGFGIWPATARLKVQTSKGIQYQYATAEVVIAPRVGAHFQPHLPIFIPPGGRIRIQMRLSGAARSPRGAFGQKGLEQFIHEPLKQAKATLRIEAPAGFTVTPSETTVNLSAAGEAKVDFIVANTGKLPDHQKPFHFLPEVELAGLGKVKIAPDPVRVYVDPLLAYEPLDERGLVLYASFDGNTKPRTVLDPKVGGQRWGPVVTRHPGRGRDKKGAPKFVPGKKGQAIANTGAWYGVEKNFNTFGGSILFWWRLPEGSDGRTAPGGGGEYNIIVQPGDLTGSWYTFWCYYRKGRLRVSYISLGAEGHGLSAKWPNDKKWHHVAMTWDFLAKSFRIYVDGKLADEDKDPTKQWLMAPFQFGRHMRNFPGWKDYYMGEYFGNPPGGAYSFKFGNLVISGGMTPREKVPYMDELYVFDRALTGKEIAKHIGDGK